MAKITSSLLTLVSLLTLGLGAAPSHALNIRSFISANGNDANPCTRTAPCRTLQKAHDSTNPGGEVNMLDPAGYGTVTITKAISIVNDGVGSAGILVPSGGTGIMITAGPDDAINLRGLIIEGAGVGVRGIQFNSGRSLTVQYCVVRNVTNVGIFFVPTASSSLAVSSTLVADNDNTGIAVSQFISSGTVRAAFDRVEVLGNGFRGISVIAGARATVTDSVVANNLAGLFVDAGPGAVETTLMAVRSAAVNNSVGIEATGANAFVYLAQSTVSGNTTGWIQPNQGTVLSYVNNYINGNIGSEAAPSAVAQK